MARVGANLLCVVIYGSFRSCYLDAGQNNQDPGNGGNGGYTVSSYKLISPKQQIRWQPANNMT